MIKGLLIATLPFLLATHLRAADYGLFFEAGKTYRYEVTSDLRLDFAAGKPSQVVKLVHQIRVEASGPSPGGQADRLLLLTERSQATFGQGESAESYDSFSATSGDQNFGAALRQALLQRLNVMLNADGEIAETSFTRSLSPSAESKQSLAPVGGAELLQFLQGVARLVPPVGATAGQSWQVQRDELDLPLGPLFFDLEGKHDGGRDWEGQQALAFLLSGSVEGQLDASVSESWSPETVAQLHPDASLSSQLYVHRLKGHPLTHTSTLNLPLTFLVAEEEPVEPEPAEVAEVAEIPDPFDVPPRKVIRAEIVHVPLTTDPDAAREEAIVIPIDATLRIESRSRLIHVVSGTTR